MPFLRSSHITGTVMLVIATALWPWPASAQLDQEITRSQTSNIQRAIENNLPPPATNRATAPCRGPAAIAPAPGYPAATAPVGQGGCVTPVPGAPN